MSRQFAGDDVSDEQLSSIHKRLVYRHVAWLYALRSQLLMVKEWEHAAQSGKTGRQARHYQKEFGVGLIDDHAQMARIGTADAGDAQVVGGRLGHWGVVI